jgi:environmental stress-induced protein Ves
MQVIRWAECQDLPWKNGAGVTREFIRMPERGDAFDWRVSVAEVDKGGPFSLFPGCDRHIAVIKGENGMVLDFTEGGSTALRLFQPFTFSGDDRIKGELPFGPVSDLNLIVRRGFGTATLTFCTLTATTFIAGFSRGHQLLHVVHGQCESEIARLGVGDSLYLCPAETAELNGTAVLAICSILAG